MFIAAWNGGIIVPPCTTYEKNINVAGATNINHYSLRVYQGFKNPWVFCPESRISFNCKMVGVRNGSIWIQLHASRSILVSADLEAEHCIWMQPNAAQDVVIKIHGAQKWITSLPLLFARVSTQYVGGKTPKISTRNDKWKWMPPGSVSWCHKPGPWQTVHVQYQYVLIMINRTQVYSDMINQHCYIVLNHKKCKMHRMITAPASMEYKVKVQRWAQLTKIWVNSNQINSFKTQINSNLF